MRNIVLNATLLLLFSKGFCQNQDSISKLIFGFNFGLNYSNLQLKNTDPGIQYSNSAGFRMGILMDWKLTKHLSFSPKTEIAFNDSKVTILKNPDTKEIYEVYPFLIEFAPHITYKLINTKTAPYILVGPSYKVPLHGNNKIHYATMRSGIAFDFGIGLDKKLTYFNFAPELRYSLGLTNLSNINGIGRLYFHSVTLVLNFKG